MKEQKWMSGINTPSENTIIDNDIVVEGVATVTGLPSNTNVQALNLGIDVAQPYTNYQGVKSVQRGFFTSYNGQGSCTFSSVNTSKSFIYATGALNPNTSNLAWNNYSGYGDGCSVAVVSFLSTSACFWIEGYTAGSASYPKTICWQVIEFY